MSAHSRASLWILGDQLRLDHPGLEQADQVVLVESERLLRRLPYQRQKLVLLLSAMRHYAEALRERGFAVDYVRAPNFTHGLSQHLERYRPARLLTMAAADYAGRQWQTQQAEAALGLPVVVLPNTQFLTGRYDPFPTPGRKVILENFYRAMRRRFGLLMDGEAPVGGQWNFDRENRRPLPKDAVPPAPLRFPPDELTQQIMAEVEAAGYGIGSVAGFGYAVTHAQARAALDDFIAHRLDLFGPYEDAMTTRHRTLYHSVLSPYVNLGLLDPLEMAQAAVDAYRAGRARLNSVEGFVRQVIGWREYMYWQYWRLMPQLAQSNHWRATRPLPGFFWTGETDLNCLRHVLRRALETGYTHHIERLMVLSNFAVLAGLEPQAVTAWFKAVYIDAYDWVMQTNVIGMGLNADGGQLATKPYIASANYINKMSDYCAGCRFNAKARTGPDACPFNTLYWNFLITHEAALKANPRTGPAVLGVNRLSADERRNIRQQARRFLDAL
jgi:deoxyribodipyrimidine photolyase-related protein